MCHEAPFGLTPCPLFDLGRGPFDHTHGFHHPEWRPSRVHSAPCLHIARSTRSTSASSGGLGRAARNWLAATASPRATNAWRSPPPRSAPCSRRSSRRGRTERAGIPGAGGVSPAPVPVVYPRRPPRWCIPGCERVRRGDPDAPPLPAAPRSAPAAPRSASAGRRPRRAPRRPGRAAPRPPGRRAPQSRPRACGEQKKGARTEAMLIDG